MMHVSKYSSYKIIFDNISKKKLFLITHRSKICFQSLNMKKSFCILFSIKVLKVSKILLGILTKIKNTLNLSLKN